MKMYSFFFIKYFKKDQTDPVFKVYAGKPESEKFYEVLTDKRADWIKLSEIELSDIISRHASNFEHVYGYNDVPWDVLENGRLFF